MVHFRDAILPDLFELIALFEQDGVPEVELGDQMAEGLQENLLEVVGDLLRLQIAEHLIEKVDYLGRLLALSCLQLLLWILGALTLGQLIQHTWLNIQKSSMEYLLSQVVHLLVFHHLMIVDECLIDEAEAVVEGWI